MTSIISGHQHNLYMQTFVNPWRGRANRLSSLGYSTPLSSSGGSVFTEGQHVLSLGEKSNKPATMILRAMNNSLQPDDDEEDNDEDGESQLTGRSEVDSRLSRENLERIVGKDDSSFSGLDLATLIRKKYGRSYDVTLIKKEFMGRSLLAMNVMWKYREQRSFPLTEEEYILRLDDVANSLKCWGAVSHIRNSLERLKERPRIGKAVSIFIDMDETGGRSDEWIYK